MRIGRAKAVGQLGLLALCLLLPACGEPSSTSSAASQTEDSQAAVPGDESAAEVDPGGIIASPEPDWPQFGGPRRDGTSDEKGLAPTWPKGGPPLVWKIGGLGYGWSSPIVVGDRLYVTGDVDDDLVIFAFDLSGKPQWQAKNGKAWTGSYHGCRACCAYSEGKLYHLNAHGRVACLDAATGKELWACDLTQRFQASEITWAFAECLLVDGRHLLVTPGSGTALMAALDKQNGQTIWTTPPLDADKATYSSPLLFRYAGRRIVANCSSAHGFGVDADTGKLLWTVPLKNTYGVNVTMPNFDGGRVFYVTAYAFGACYRLRPGKTGWKAENVWRTTLDTCTGSVLLVNGLLIGSGYEKHRTWLCLDWATGQPLYEFTGLTIGSAVFADGRMYCLGVDGQVSLVKPARERFEVNGRFQLLPHKVRDAWAHPVLLHGKLYLRYHDRLWCYDVGAK